MILVGELALWVALLMAAWGAIVSFAGGRAQRPELIASGERAVYATFACVVLAATGLIVALVSSDFSFAHVASHTTANLPVAYKIAALWAGQAGSLLFCAFLLSACAAIAVSTRGARRRALSPYIDGTLSLLLLFSLAVLCFGASPYERVPMVPPEGRGLSPQLQSPGMLVHPPTLYLGYVSTAIPFAFAVAALLAGKLDDDWLDAVRRWSLVAWVALTTGMMSGMWWAYVEPDWHRDWAWDGVRNAALLPWLTTTMSLYLTLTQEGSGRARKAIVLLAASSILLAVTAAFASTGGIISGVSTFAQSAARARAVAFVLVTAAGVAYLAARQLRSLQISLRLEDSARLGRTSPLNNLLLMGIALSLASATLLPMLSAARRSGNVTDVTAVDPYVVLAIGIGALVLGAIVRQVSRAATTRCRTTGESVPSALTRMVVSGRRHYGGFAVRVGVLILAIAFAGFAFKTEVPVSLSPGETVTLLDPYGRQWTFASQGVSDFQELNRHVVAVPLRATHADTPVALLRAERRQYVDSRGSPTFDPSTNAGIHSSPRQDTYVTLASVADDRAVLRIAFNPLVMWVWIGGMVLVVGGLMAMWPGRRPSGGS